MFTTDILFVLKSRFIHDSGTKTRQPPIRIGSSWNPIESCDTYRESYDTNYHGSKLKIFLPMTPVCACVFCFHNYVQGRVVEFRGTGDAL
ncbi:hypothetical protein JHK85_018302 [Glycine max]|nr:hypothetical protein JHK85_018302 [Glycine max]KAH1085902.1 hypothetical protein GYH30_017731 [Glycine max]